MICVVDYGCGNLFSINRALDVLNIDHIVSDDPETVAKSGRILFPGVGTFGEAMALIRGRGLLDALQEVADKGGQIVGICLGAQLLMSRGFEYGEHDGLDLIPGEVHRLPEPAGPTGTRIPNIGWRKVDAKPGYGDLNVLRAAPYFYFVHSYGVRCTDPADVKGTINVNGAEVPAIIGKGNLWGFQFHPEKSGRVGLQLLDQTLNRRHKT